MCMIETKGTGQNNNNKKLPNLSALGLEYVLTVLTSHFSIDLMYTQLKQLVKLLNFGVHVAF